MLALVFFLMGCVVLLKLSIQDIYRYKRLLGEGGILEYLQALILFTSAWVSWLIARDLWKRLEMRYHGLIYAMISLGMLFVGLEEIAWGQVLFGWKTPENIAAVNAQNQTTLHNLEIFQNYLDLNLFLVSVALLIFVLWRPPSRWIQTIMPNGKSISNNAYFIPRYFWPLFFFAALLSYFVATESGTELVINIDQEWAEFVLLPRGRSGLIKNLHFARQRRTKSNPLNKFFWLNRRDASSAPSYSFLFLVSPDG